MNLLSGKIILAPRPDGAIELTQQRFMTNQVDLHVERIAIFNFQNRNICYDSMSQIACGMIGYVSNLGEIKSQYGFENSSDVEVLSRLYCLLKTDFAAQLDGVYTIFIFDGAAKQIFLFQDRYGSQLPLYYVQHGNELFFSSSLKALLSIAPIKRELNIDAIYNFLYHKKTIAAEFTLIKRVNKLLPNQMIAIDLQSCSVMIRPIKRRDEKISRSVAKSELIRSITSNLERLYSHLSDRRIALTLSGGYDTNLLLSYLRKLSTASFTAITIGGITRNEIDQAKQIVRHYQPLHHITRVIPESLIDALPDIVWRTEGAVFNEGLFLQYALANILAEEGHQFIFLGDCADQQLDHYRNSWHQRLLRDLKRTIKSSWCGLALYRLTKQQEPISPKTAAFQAKFRRFSMNLYPFGDLDFEFILRKGGLMLNSVGIQGIYPYLNETTRAMSKALGRLNFRKRYYKNQVKASLDRNVAGYIQKGDGRTDIEYLITARQSLMSELLRTEFIRGILTKDQIDVLMNHSNYYPAIMLHLMYIYLFHQMFITGRFDAQFNQPGLSIILPTFFDGQKS
ncbi:MAG: asparagine synthase-related protein [candidate division KSB1 bacterium]|nr:asparagine synthase-related protein [candidate division KSB1 bacterium]